MQQIPLQSIPNQSFSIRLDNNLYNITIQQAYNVMAATIARNGVTLVSGQRIVPGGPIIPYSYLTDGNFVILTRNRAYPFYTEFGITQFLIFASAAEIEAINAGN